MCFLSLAVYLFLIQIRNRTLQVAGMRQVLWLNPEAHVVGRCGVCMYLGVGQPHSDPKDPWEARSL